MDANDSAQTKYYSTARFHETLPFTARSLHGVVLVQLGHVNISASRCLVDSKVSSTA